MVTTAFAPIWWILRLSRLQLNTTDHRQRKEHPSRKGKYKIADAGRPTGAPAINGKEMKMDYSTLYEFDNLYNAYKKARKGKRWKGATVKYEMNALEATLYLQHLLKTKNYKMGKYNVFKVYEPKERVIMSTTFKDKVVQHSLCDNIIEPALERTFIYDNCASRRNKGVHFGLDRLSGFLREFHRRHGCDGWVLKCDISKYFYSIDHNVLKSQLRKHIQDEDIIELLDVIIDSTDNPGIPIGNQTSQFFALLYMNGLDHFVKEKLRIKYYGRYMDDFYLIHEDKQYLQYCRREIEGYVGNLKLRLNNKTAIFPIKNGLNFLGFHTYLTESGKAIRKLRRDSKQRMRRKLKKFKELYAARKITKEEINASFESWKSHASHGHCYHLIRNMQKYYDELFEEGGK